MAERAELEVRENNPRNTPITDPSTRHIYITVVKGDQVLASYHIAASDDLAHPGSISISADTGLGSEIIVLPEACNLVRVAEVQ